MHEAPPKSSYLARSFNYVLVTITEIEGTEIEGTEIEGTRTNALNDLDHRHVTATSLNGRR
jgi:hypothetical protein